MQLWEGGRVRERVGAALVGVGGFGWAEEERRWGGRETERQREGKREGGREREKEKERERQSWENKRDFTWRNWGSFVIF